MDVGFLHSVAGPTLKNNMTSLDIQGELNVGLLLLCIKRCQLRWFAHLVKNPPGCLPGKVGRVTKKGSGLLCFAASMTQTQDSQKKLTVAALLKLLC